MSDANSSSAYTLGVVGCGQPLGSPGATGYGMSHRHVQGFLASGRCRLAGAASRTRTKAEAFVATYASEAPVFTDYREMLAAVRPEIVCISLWTPLHEEAVLAAAEAGPRLIFCEKPVATHWDAALRMQAVCRERGVMLAFNHQRRFNRPLLRARDLVRDGAIGRLRRMEGAWHDLGDTGTHVVDMFFYFNEDTPAEWVLGQVEMRGARRVFGQLHAGQGLSQIRFANGVRGLYQCGHQHEELGCLVRLVGEEGIIEILHDAPWLRLLRSGGGVGWEAVDTGESIHDNAAIHRATAHVLDCLERGVGSELDVVNALRATEVLFATHESARRRGRVDLPLASAPCALLSMLDAGELVLEGEPPELFG